MTLEHMLGELYAQFRVLSTERDNLNEQVTRLKQENLALQNILASNKNEEFNKTN